MSDATGRNKLAESLGWPPYYFSIRSASNGRYWDIYGNFTEDGTLVYLWREKEHSLVESLRDPRADNQCFYIDETGALCSKASGHAIDIEDGRVVLRRRRPVTLPFPNPYSHPLPRFMYDSSSGNIHVKFAHDPAYPPPSDSPSVAWRERQYLVSSVPLAKPRSIFDNAVDFFSSTATMIASGGTENKAVHLDQEGEFDLTEGEIMEEERGHENDADDHPDVKRDIVVLSLPLATRGGRTDGGGSVKARERRCWEILPITPERRTYNRTTSKS